MSVRLRTGIDIIEVDRVARLVETSGTSFLQRWFTEGEIAYCASQAVPARHFAARLAAKEAVVKCLRWHWAGPIPWRSIEIHHDETGAPLVTIVDDLADAIAERVADLQLSLSHTEEFAAASVVALVE